MHAGVAEKNAAPIELLHSDALEIKNYDDDIIINLIGNVRLKQDSTYISSGRALWYKSAGQVVLIDSVFLEDSKGGTVLADRATYYRSSRKVTAIGNVLAHADSGKVIITGQQADYLRDKQYLKVTGNPRLTAKGEKDTSSVAITARVLEYLGDQDMGIATDSVRIVKGDLLATGDYAHFYRKDEYAVLSGRPIARIEKSQLEGDTIIVYTADEKVSRIGVKGQAKATYQPAPDSADHSASTSILTGERLDFFFTSEKPDSSIVIEHATSFYQPSSTDSASGTNEASGDTIKFFVGDEKLKRALILGGARGTYYFIPEDAPRDSAVQDTVHYIANSIDYRAEDSSIILVGNSNVAYKNMNLQAHRIIYVTSNDYVFAEGDSVVDADSSYYKNPPILNDGQDKIIGYKMEYNIKSEKGRITYGDTQFEGGFYEGKDVRKITDEILYVKDGIYTSCDLLNPHYGFRSKRMKLITRDKVIAKPVIMYIGDLPVAILPYYIFPIKKGRHSGFTTFEIGNFERGERFIRNVGYYWAATDYWDLQGTFDYFEDSHVGINLVGRYVLRYSLSGNISASYVHESRFQNMTRIRRKRWRLNYGHNQTLTETMVLAASGSFMSDKSFSQDISYDPEEIRNREISSHFSLSKKYDQASLTVALQQNWNLDTDIRTEQLPSVRYSRMNQPLIPYEEPKKKNVEKHKLWYHNIYYSYTFDGRNYRQINRQNGQDLWKEHATANNRLSLSSPINIAGVLTLTPQGSLQESWYYIPTTYDAESQGLETKAFKQRLTYDFGASAKTTLYGSFALNAGFVQAFRHVMTPTISYNWKPEFKKNAEYYEYTGVGSAGAKVNSIALSLGNLFQIKGKLKDKEYKLDLFALNSNTGYDFNRKGQKWSTLNTTISSTTILRRLSLSADMRHSFYSKSISDTSPDFLHPRLLNFNISASVSFAGKGGAAAPATPEGEIGYFHRKRTPETPAQAPWSLSLAARYSETRGSVSKSITRWVNLNYETPITSGWRTKYECRYDVEGKKIAEQQLQISRDLHCWQGSFVWIPTGFRSGYYIKVNIIDLPEVKVEKSEGGIKGGYY